MRQAIDERAWEAGARTELANHPIAKALKEMGLSDQDLAGVRFLRHDLDEPFENWPITWPHQLDIGHNPKLAGLLRDYAALRYALVDGPKTKGPHQSCAWDRVGGWLSQPFISSWMNQLVKNRKNATLPRGLISLVGESSELVSMRSIVEDYAMKPDIRNLSPRQIWFGFGPYFSEVTGSTIFLEGDEYQYLDDRSLKFVTFKNYAYGARSASH